MEAAAAVHSCEGNRRRELWILTRQFRLTVDIAQWPAGMMPSLRSGQTRSVPQDESAIESGTGITILISQLIKRHREQGNPTGSTRLKSRLCRIGGSSQLEGTADLSRLGCRREKRYEGAVMQVAVGFHACTSQTPTRLSSEGRQLRSYR